MSLYNSNGVPNNPFAFDLDGVVIDSHPILFGAMKAKYGIDFDNKTVYDFHVPGVSQKEVVKSIQEILIEHTYQMKLFESSIKCLRYLYNILNTPLIFVTARNYANKELIRETHCLLHKYLDIPFYVAYMGDNNKGLFLKKNDIRYFIEDRYKYMIDVAKYVRVVFLKRYKHNRNRGRYPNNCVPIDSLMEILGFVLLEALNKNC